MGKSDSTGQDYELGVALVSILVSIALSVGFGVYSITGTWWMSLLCALAVPTVIAIGIRVGGEDGWIGRAGRWVLGS